MNECWLFDELDINAVLFPGNYIFYERTMPLGGGINYCSLIL